MEKLIEKLNKEYKNIGVISISKMHQKDVQISSIDYVKNIMDIIEPLTVDEPIIVAKTWRNDNYVLIDGYHRLKSKILDGGGNIEAIILDDFLIKRKYDTLFEFLSGLIGSKLNFKSEELILVDGKYFEIKANEGCGGCGNGWSSIKVLLSFINKEIVVKTIESKDENGDTYNLYINGEKVAEVDTGYGNGYYGGDFEVFIRD
jgi:hypothetical protein